MSGIAVVLVGCLDDTVWAQVTGRGTFQVSAGLKQFSQKMMAKGYRKFIVDLCECELMDSTFMGMLTGIALHLREKGVDGLQVIRANERNAGLLLNLGLDQLFIVRKIGDPETPEIPCKKTLDEAPVVKPEGVDTKTEILEAHQALVQADPANAIRFQDVLECLQKEIDDEKKSS